MTEQGVRGGSLSRRWALVVALGVPVLVLLGLGIGYYRLVYFERVAALHVPAGSRFAARVDLEQVVLFEPARKNLLPALDAATAQVNGQTLSQRITTATDVNLSMDLREILFAIGPNETQWLVALSGRFTKGMLPGIASAVSADPRIAASVADGVLRIEPWGLFVAQAEDRTVLISNEQALLREVLLPTQAFRELGLLREGAGSGVASLSEATPQPFSTLRRVRADVSLGATVMLKVDAEAQEDQAARWLAEAKVLTAAEGRGDRVWDALRPALARAESAASSQNHWAFQTFLERGEVDTLAAALAAKLAARLRLTGTLEK